MCIRDRPTGHRRAGKDFYAGTAAGKHAELQGGMDYHRWRDCRILIIRNRRIRMSEAALNAMAQQYLDLTLCKSRYDDIEDVYKRQRQESLELPSLS